MHSTMKLLVCVACAVLPHLAPAQVVSCIVEMRVEESTSLQTPLVWKTLGVIPVAVTQFDVNPTATGTHWYRVVAKLLDGSEIRSDAASVLVTPTLVPRIPVNIHVQIAGILKPHMFIYTDETST